MFGWQSTSDGDRWKCTIRVAAAHCRSRRTVVSFESCRSCDVPCGLRLGDMRAIMPCLQAGYVQHTRASVRCRAQVTMTSPSPDSPRSQAHVIAEQRPSKGRCARLGSIRTGSSGSVAALPAPRASQTNGAGVTSLCHATPAAARTTGRARSMVLFAAGGSRGIRTAQAFPRARILTRHWPAEMVMNSQLEGSLEGTSRTAATCAVHARTVRPRCPRPW